VILIPYAQNDRFNRACSPTKIMDGLGSGRPIVATAIPECRLYAYLRGFQRCSASLIFGANSCKLISCVCSSIGSRVTPLYMYLVN